MWIPDIPGWALHIGNKAVLFGAAWFMQSTVILSIGLIGILLLRKRGAAVQSFLLRVFLAAALAAPAVSFVVEKTGLDLVHLSIPPATVPSKGTDASASALSLHSGDIPKPVPSRTPLQPVVQNTMRSPTPLTGRSTVLPADTQPHSSSPSKAPATVRVHHSSAQAGQAAFPFRALFYCAFACAWIVLTAVLLVRLLFHMLIILYLRYTAYEAAPGYIDLCRSFARESGVHPPEVLQHPSVRSPFLAGFIRPAVFLPLGDHEKALAPDEALLHEIAHLSRNDTFWNLVRHGAAAILPFQPLMWVYSRRIEETGDYACDDLVVHNLGNSRRYALNLTGTFCALNGEYAQSTMEVGFLSFSSSLRRRVERLLDASRTITTRIGSGMLVLVYSLCICVSSVAGLVGIRSKSFDQIRSLRETVARKAAAVTMTAAAALREQADAPDESGSDKSSGAPDDTVAPEPTPAGDDTPLDETAVTSAMTSAREHDGASAGIDITPLPAPPAESRTETAPSTIPIADARPAAPLSESQAVENPVRTSSAAAVSPALPPSFIGLQSTVAGNNEAVAAKPGPLEITVPPEAPAVLRESLAHGQENPVWSPTGSLIAFTGYGGNGIWTVSVHGGRPSLVYDNSGDPSPTGSAPFYKTARILCFTPDGKEITIARYSRTASGNAAGKNAATAASPSMPVIETIDLRTGERTGIVQDACEGCWSPDGRYFIYGRGNDNGIYTLDRLSGIHRKVSESGKSPTVTPDGSSIIYVDWSVGDMGRLYRAPITGGAPELLVSGGFWLNPKVSPDGVWVLCSNAVQEIGSYARMMSYNLTTGRMYDILIKTAESAVMGDWSPKGGQYCCTLFGGKVSSGSSSKTSAISIGDFQPMEPGQPVSVVATPPAEFKLIGNYPNPFNPVTTIRFSLPSEGMAELAIYGMNGQKIRELVSGRMEAGSRSVVWNGRDDDGRPVSSGVYIARLKMNGKVESRRMTLVK